VTLILSAGVWGRVAVGDVVLVVVAAAPGLVVVDVVASAVVDVVDVGVVLLAPR
jgi:hypothetical protein